MTRRVGWLERLIGSLIDPFARITLPLFVEMRIEGAEHVPRTGATVIASRHYHFLFDALALLRSAGRPARIWNALDWTTARWQRAGMELLVRSARWPAMLRVDAYSMEYFRRGASAYTLAEAQPMLRAATQQVIELLRAGGVLIIFPEAYTNVDLLPTPKANGPEFLPFRPGFAKLAQLAERDGVTQVSIVPAGFTYERVRRAPFARWRVTLRYGEPVSVAPDATRAEVAALVAQVEATVQALSHATPSGAPIAIPTARA